MSNPTNEQELREQINVIRERLVGRNQTHQQVARLSKWTRIELENVIKEDGWIYEDEMIALIQAYTNAEIAKVLERLESELNEQKKAAETNLAYHVDVTKNERLIRDWQGTVHGIEFCRPAIAAERAKLKEVK